MLFFIKFTGQRCGFSAFPRQYDFGSVVIRNLEFLTFCVKFSMFHLYAYIFAPFFWISLFIYLLYILVMRVVDSRN